MNDSVSHVPINNEPFFTLILRDFVEYGAHTQHTVHVTVTMENVMACATLTISTIPSNVCLHPSWMTSQT